MKSNAYKMVMLLTTQLNNDKNNEFEFFIFSNGLNRIFNTEWFFLRI